MEHGIEYQNKQAKLEKLNRIATQMRNLLIEKKQLSNNAENVRAVRALEEEIQTVYNEIDELEHELKLLYRDEIRKFYFEQEGLKP